LEGWHEMAQDIRSEVYKVNIDAKIYFFRGWDYTTVPQEWQNTWRATAYWPPGAGDGPCPGFYRECQSATEIDDMRAHLEYTGVAGGYPWLAPYKQWGGQTVDMNIFVGLCQLLKDHGAAGFSLYPSAYSIDNGPLSNPNNEKILQLMKAGAEVFK
jgi:hypothetical protein